MAGLNSIVQLRERVTGFKNGLVGGLYLSRIVKDNESFICDMNAEQQLFEQGVNRLGVKISDYAPYSPYTIEIKKMKGQPTDRVTLRDTGDFHESFYITVGNDRFEIKASDWKTEKLMKKYGRGILGLTQENLAELIWQYIYPELLKTAKETIYG
jgi:hypothetical protein